MVQVLIIQLICSHNHEMVRSIKIVLSWHACTAVISVTNALGVFSAVCNCAVEIPDTSTVHDSIKC